jgi:hypothetical protein
MASSVPHIIDVDMMYRESVMPQFEVSHYPIIFLERLKKTFRISVRIVGLQVKV